MAAKRRHKNARLGFFSFFMYLFFTLLLVRLVIVQDIKRHFFIDMAKDQHTTTKSLDPQRGKIYDRNGHILAFNVPSTIVVAHADSIKDIWTVAKKVAPLVGKEPSVLVKKIQDNDGWVELAKDLPNSVQEKIKNLNNRYVGCRNGYTRKYPQGESACQLLGFVRRDGTGGNGIEMAWDKELKGTPGTAIYQKTGRARIFSHPHYPIRFAQDGDDIFLTINYRYQKIAEEELKRTVAEYNAESGAVVILEPFTGDILAISSIPQFDPNRYSDYNEISWKLLPITDQFEPGSTYKVAMLAAMFDSGYKNEKDQVFCENGSWSVMGETITDTKKLATLSARDVLVYSSNIGMAKMAKDFDKYKMYSYAEKFGFGKKTGVELEGEITGQLKKPQDWYPFSQLAIAFGHEIAVTPLQMCAMYNTIASDGLYISPRVISHIVRDGEPVHYADKKNSSPAVSKETARLIRKIMTEAVERGTAVNAQIKNMSIAAKTGTAHIAQTGGRGYAKNRYISSFGGFFPAEEPKITIFVMIKDPRGAYFGGTVAAPCFKRIAERILDYEGYDYFQENQDREEIYAGVDSLTAPNLIGYERSRAIYLLKKWHIIANVKGDGLVIMSQEPSPGSLIVEGQTMYLATKTQTAQQTDTSSMPSVTGLSLRSALYILSAHGINAQFIGNGKVIRQIPEADQPLAENSSVQLICQNVM